MLADTVQADKELRDDEGVDISIEDMSRDERASLLQEQLAIHYRCRYLSHTSALCKLVFLATQASFQFIPDQPASVLDHLYLLTICALNAAVRCASTCLAQDASTSALQEFIGTLVRGCGILQILEPKHMPAQHQSMIFPQRKSFCPCSSMTAHFCSFWPQNPVKQA